MDTLQLTSPLLQVVMSVTTAEFGMTEELGGL